MSSYLESRRRCRTPIGNSKPNLIHVSFLSKGCGTLVYRIVDGENIIAILTDNRVIFNKEMAEKTVATFRCNGTNETLEVYLQPEIFFESSGVGTGSFHSHVIFNKKMAEKTMATFRCNGTNETLEMYLQPENFFQSGGGGQVPAHLTLSTG